MTFKKNDADLAEKANSRTTPLHDLHVALGAKMVDFAGWQMPLQYPAGIMNEHKQCREQAALFDVSHMGQLKLNGVNTASNLETLVPSDINTLPPGKARYTFFTNESGGIMDDLIITNAGDYFYVVVNASMCEQDIKHLRDGLQDIAVNQIQDHALIALQGPKAIDVLAPLCQEASSLVFMESMLANVDGTQCRVSRLGYTGEDGFEISIPKERAVSITQALLANDACAPAGLGARDSLRLEAGLCLYGSDINDTTSPIEASLLWAIQKRRREEGGFPGDQIIQRQIREGTQRKLVGIKPEGRAPARHGVVVMDSQGESIGEVTSGCFGPSAGGPVALAYVATAHSQPGSPVHLSIRGKSYPASVVKTPFVTQNYKR